MRHINELPETDIKTIMEVVNKTVETLISQLSSEYNMCEDCIRALIGETATATDEEEVGDEHHVH